MQARELKSVYVDVVAQFLRIVFHKLANEMQASHGSEVPYEPLQRSKPSGAHRSELLGRGATCASGAVSVEVSEEKAVEVATVAPAVVAPTPPRREEHSEAFERAGGLEALSRGELFGLRSRKRSQGLIYSHI